MFSLYTCTQANPSANLGGGEKVCKEAHDAHFLCDYEAVAEELTSLCERE